MISGPSYDFWRCAYPKVIHCGFGNFYIAFVRTFVSYIDVFEELYSANQKLPVDAHTFRRGLIKELFTATQESELVIMNYGLIKAGFAGVQAITQGVNTNPTVAADGGAVGQQPALANQDSGISFSPSQGDPPSSDQGSTHGRGSMSGNPNNQVAPGMALLEKRIVDKAEEILTDIQGAVDDAVSLCSVI